MEEESDSEAEAVVWPQEIQVPRRQLDILAMCMEEMIRSISEHHRQNSANNSGQGIVRDGGALNRENQFLAEAQLLLDLRDALYSDTTGQEDDGENFREEPEEDYQPMFVPFFGELGIWDGEYERSLYDTPDNVGEAEVDFGGLLWQQVEEFVALADNLED